MKLTNMEKMVLNAMRENDYNDALQDGGTWLFCATEYSDLDTKQARGALSSLIKKELVEVTEIKEAPNESMVGFTEAGEKVFDNADGEECSWGGPRLLKIEEEVEEVKEEKEMKNLNEMTVKELRAEAKARGIKGYSRISKDDLIEMIKATEGVIEEVVEEKVETVVMKAFTGMLIGEFKVVAETEEVITVETKKGIMLSFDTKTGIQLNPNNPKFANRIEIA